MHFDALRYFRTVVEEKSISKAAAKTHLSQSALSQMILKLEEDLGVDLLNRSNRGVSLTEPGEIVLKYSNNILKSIDKMMDDLNSYNAHRDKITISGTWSLASYSLPCMLFAIKKQFKDKNFDLEAKTVDEIIHGIREDLADLGFVDQIVEDDNLDYYLLGKEKVVLIAKKDYKVPDVIQLEDLLGLELIMCTMNKKTIENLDNVLKCSDKTVDDLNVIFNADSFTSVKSSVMNGFGMAFVPYEAVKRELYEGFIKLVEVENVNLDYEIYMVSKKNKDLSKSVKIAKDYMIEIGTASFC